MCDVLFSGETSWRSVTISSHLIAEIRTNILEILSVIISNVFNLLDYSTYLARSSFKITPVQIRWELMAENPISFTFTNLVSKKEITSILHEFKRVLLIKHIGKQSVQCIGFNLSIMYFTIKFPTQPFHFKIRQWEDAFVPCVTS